MRPPAIKAETPPSFPKPDLEKEVEVTEPVKETGADKKIITAMVTALNSIRKRS